MTEAFKLEVGMRVKDGTSGELGTCTEYDPHDDTYQVAGDESGPGWYTPDGRNLTFPADDSMAVFPITE